MILNIKPAVPPQIGEIIAAYASSVGVFAEECADMAEFFAKSIKNSLLTAVITCDRVVRGVVVCEKSPIPEGTLCTENRLCPRWKAPCERRAQRVMRAALQDRHLEE